MKSPLYKYKDRHLTRDTYSELAHVKSDCCWGMVYIINRELIGTNREFRGELGGSYTITGFSPNLEQQGFYSDLSQLSFPGSSRIQVPERKSR